MACSGVVAADALDSCRLSEVEAACTVAAGVTTCVLLPGDVTEPDGLQAIFFEDVKKGIFRREILDLRRGRCLVRFSMDMLSTGICLFAGH